MRNRIARAVAMAAGVVCELLEERRLLAASTPIISEFLAGNKTGLRDSDGDTSDWIEIYNPTASPVGLAGWGISDDAAILNKWTFPDVTLAAGGRMVIFASDKNRVDPAGQLHTNFKLSGGGEYLGLTNATGTTVFEYAPAYPEQEDDVSFGVLDTDPTAQRFFSPPTPGGPNDSASVGAVNEPVFSVERGFYNSAFQLSLSTPTAGASIRYTLDGSPPSETDGTLYGGPITISETSNVRAIAYRHNFITSGINTQTYIFLDQVIHQPANIANWPRPFINVGGTDSRQMDYEMDPAIVNNSAYSGAIKKGLTDIPTISLVVKQSDMWDASGNGGFYRVNDIEVPVSLEIIYANAPQKNVHVDGLVEGHNDDRMKRSLRLKFNSETPDAKLKTSLLKDAVVNTGTAADDFKRLTLRAGSNRSFARGDLTTQTTYAEDEWVRGTQVALSGYGSHGAFAHLYINGLYWGLYNPVERPDVHFQAEYFGGDSDNWFDVDDDGPRDGDPARYNYLTGALKNKNMAVLANYNEMKQYLDVQNLSDYLLGQFYAGVTDWPGSNYWGGNRNAPEQITPHKFFSWDGEYSFGVGVGKGPSLESPPHAWVSPPFRKSVDTSTFSPVAQLFNAVKKSPEFKILLADRAYRATANGGALTDALAQSRWDKLTNQIRDAIIAESARWGDMIDANSPVTRNGAWQAEVNRIRNYMTGNAADLIAALRAEGYYPATNPATFNVRGGTVPKGFGVKFNNPNGAGTVYYTLNGADPRAVVGGVSSSAKIYNGTAITLNANTRIRVRILRNGEWSAGDDVNFTTSTSSKPVISQPPVSQTKPAGQQVTFTVTAIGPGTLTYQWQRNSVNIANAKSASYTFTATAADNGANYRVLVTNSFGTTTSAAAKLTIGTTSAFSPLKINFQPAAAPTVAGYTIDSGSVYGARGNGRTFGWTSSHTGQAVDRNVNANQLLDTNIGVLAGQKWQLAVPNGTYSVKVSVGDAKVATKATTFVEGIQIFNYQSLNANTFASKTMTVNVADGQLTIGVGVAANLSVRLDFLEITKIG